jgi:hypothetical protein
VCQAAAAAGRWRLIAPNIRRFDSDSERYVAWQVQEDSPIVVLDMVTGQTREIPGCSVPDIEQPFNPNGWPAGHGLFIIYCGNTSELYNARTGAVKALPGGEFGPSWQVVGARYLEGVASATDCRQDAMEKREQDNCIALYEIATGRVSYRPHSQISDLDRPGAPLVCPALRKKVLANIGIKAGDYTDQLFGEPSEPIRIWRCHGRPIVVRHSEGSEHLNLHGGLVSWGNVWNVIACANEECPLSAVRHGTVSAYSLYTRRRWTFTPPARKVDLRLSHKVLGVFGYSSHTHTMLFWIATRTLSFGNGGPPTVATSAVYAAKL